MTAPLTPRERAILGPTPGANDMTRLEQRLSQSLALLRSAPTVEALREVEHDAREIAYGLRVGTFARQQALRLAAKLRLLRKAAERRRS